MECKNARKMKSNKTNSPKTEVLNDERKGCTIRIKKFEMKKSLSNLKAICNKIQFSLK